MHQGSLEELTEPNDPPRSTRKYFSLSYTILYKDVVNVSSNSSNNHGSWLMNSIVLNCRGDESPRISRLMRWTPGNEEPEKIFSEPVGKKAGGKPVGRKARR